jgi:hypothetical protein
MVGYLGGARVGAVAYDAAHTLVFPIVLATGGVLAETDRAVQLALIWLTHIGIDRAIGYGLKYPTGSRTRTSSASRGRASQARPSSRRRETASGLAPSAGPR